MTKKNIFCFTFAGGTAAFFDNIAEELKDKYEVICFDYPGHGKRHKEQLCVDFDEVCNAIYPEIEEYVKSAENIEYALMGYSMGSIAAFAMLQKIQSESQICYPKHIFIAAHEPMTKVKLLDMPSEKIDAFVKERTLAFQAVPETLINNKSFWRMYLPIYKADYLMIARYSFEKISFRTEVACTVFYSEEDTKYVDMQNWSKYFEYDCKFVQYEGSHFFIKEYYKEMAGVIKERFV